MLKPGRKASPRRKAVMLGVGLDADGHQRVTTGPNFALVGGSKTTHEEMTEKAIKINEKLVAKAFSIALPAPLLRTNKDQLYTSIHRARSESLLGAERNRCPARLDSK